MSWKILLVFSLAFAVILAGCISPPPGPVPMPAGTIGCGDDLECLSEAAEQGKPAIAFVNQGDGVVFSHLVKECSNRVCVVAIRLEEFPEELPDAVRNVIDQYRDMECVVAMDSLGSIPEKISDCSGSFVEGAKMLNPDWEEGSE